MNFISFLLGTINVTILFIIMIVILNIITNIIEKNYEILHLKLICVNNLTEKLICYISSINNQQSLSLSSFSFF